MSILVTGGLGFIGSHTIVELIKSYHNVIIVDNLINSKIEVLGRLNQITGTKIDFYQVDATDEAKLNDIFKSHIIDGIIHFAGHKAVSESISNPIEYYHNNLVSTMVLCKLCVKYEVRKFVFSSSATVYGQQTSPLKENMVLKKATNPYGETKAVSERILTDMVKANPDWCVALLRYFNPAGGHFSGMLGEDPNGKPNNLMPYITQVAAGKRDRLSIFGNDYPTKDGTGVRDYIHVMDLAEGHVVALKNLQKGVHIYNLGTGKGYSVLDLVRIFEKVTGQLVPYEFQKRRLGDLAVCYADVRKAYNELGWKAKRTLEDICNDAWRWELNSSINNGQLNG